MRVPRVAVHAAAPRPENGGINCAVDQHHRDTGRQLQFGSQPRWIDQRQQVVFDKAALVTLLAGQHPIAVFQRRERAYTPGELYPGGPADRGQVHQRNPLAPQAEQATEQGEGDKQAVQHYQEFSYKGIHGAGRVDPSCSDHSRPPGSNRKVPPPAAGAARHGLPGHPARIKPDFTAERTDMDTGARSKNPSQGGAAGGPSLLQQKYLLTVAALVAALILAVVAAPAPEATENQWYQYREPSRDGIGKYYMGREISHVMGHRGAGWLERPEREREERTDLLVKELGLRDTDVVADIGAGTGYFVFRMSPLLPRGEVMAVDIQPEMLAIISDRAQQAAANVTPVLGTTTDTRLPPASVDLILLVDAYHEFSHPREMGESMVRALKPGGRIALVEYRKEDPRVPIKPLHKMSEAQARKELQALGLRWLETRSVLPQQHLMFFEKPQG